MARSTRILVALAFLGSTILSQWSATASAASLTASAVAGDRSARISWTIATPPSPVDSVEVTLKDDATVLCTAGAADTSCDIPGLTNDTPVEFDVTATFVDTTTATDQVAVTPAPLMLDNGRFRFGGGQEGGKGLPDLVSSINTSGNLLQPFYWNRGVPSPEGPRWEKLTFSSYPLDIAVGSGTSGDNWTGATVVENATLADQTIIPLSFTCADRATRSEETGAYDSAACPTDGSTTVGWGRVESSGIATINGQDLRVTSVYELTADGQFVKIVTSLSNLDTSAAPNVNLWVGTRDDYVGFENSGSGRRADGPFKEKGNLSGPSFARIAAKSDPASALQITSADGTVLFFSSTPNTNMSVDSCCRFSNAYDKDPVTSGITEGPADGSYALHLPLGDLAPAGSFGSSQELIWFYAGGPIGDASSLASSVSAAAPPAAPVPTPGHNQVKLDWVIPTNVASPDGFRIRTTDVAAGTEATSDVVDGSAQTATISSLTNDKLYRFEIAALTGATPGPFSSASEAVPGRPIGVLPTITPGAGWLPEDTLTGDAREADWRWLEGDGVLTTVLRWEQDGAVIDGATATTYAIPAGTAPSGFRLVVERTSTRSGLSASVASATVNFGDLRPTALSLSTGTLDPTFDRDVTEYTVEVPNATTSVRVRPTLQSPTTAKVNGATVSSGSQSGSISLDVGVNTITLTTAIGSSTRGISIVVTRAAASGAPPAAPAAPIVVAPPLPSGPVLTAGAPPETSRTPVARVGDVDVPVASTPAGTTRQVGTTTVSTATILEVGGVSLAVDVTGAGEVRTNAGAAPEVAAPEVTVVRDRVARTSGGGLLPGTQVQAWLPLGGTNARTVVTLPVAEDGTFTGELPFDGSADRQSDGRPLPIGRHVLQFVGVDAAGQVTVIEQTVRIEQPSPSPEPDRSAGAPPTLTPGRSIATNAGVPETVNVVPVPDVRQARVEGSGWTMAVDIPSADGRVAPAEGGGALIELVEDDVAEVSGDGFLPGTRADVWLFSTPTLLGTVTISADGTFSGEVPVEGIDTGEHTLQLQGVGTDGYIRAANLGVVVVPRATDEPAAEPEPEPEVAPAPEPESQPEDRVGVVTAAGEDAGGSGLLVWIALLAAAAGSGWWFLLGRRRRDEDEEELAQNGTTA